MCVKIFYLLQRLSTKLQYLTTKLYDRYARSATGKAVAKSPKCYNFTKIDKLRPKRFI